MVSELEKMAAGEWYTCRDPSLTVMQDAARMAVHRHNTRAPDERGTIGEELRSLLGHVGQGCMIEAGFHCAYATNIHLGDNVYMNAGCTILDTAPVMIGSDTMFGPNVQIYCPEHHHDPELRAQGLECGKPITIGQRVWVGGGAILLGGITVGDGAIVGAGSVVTRDVPAGATVVGNPARTLG